MVVKREFCALIQKEGKTLKKGDLVLFQDGGLGKIKRVAKDGSWADVDCLMGWSKRIPEPEKWLTLYK